MIGLLCGFSIWSDNKTCNLALFCPFRQYISANNLPFSLRVNITMYKSMSCSGCSCAFRQEPFIYLDPSSCTTMCNQGLDIQEKNDKELTKNCVLKLNGILLLLNSLRRIARVYVTWSFNTSEYQDLLTSSTKL